MTISAIEISSRTCPKSNRGLGTSTTSFLSCWQLEALQRLSEHLQVITLLFYFLLIKTSSRINHGACAPYSRVHASLLTLLVSILTLRGSVEVAAPYFINIRRTEQLNDWVLLFMIIHPYYSRKGELFQDFATLCSPWLLREIWDLPCVLFDTG